ncbi:PREDICTED: uncharacterized protein LOC105566597 [Vollenhovia emeryi]|uniref:uncharacterized protein LOC105566597 n=1 Tax=Vollenhovia emeryi TaxID=411798 RepID=UPI0005F3FAED|nr:PREDICTED: uncharacterized protein LOC105566597 [Vollenhovia emeryi]XP_011876111.1 PREDICTED: uncharacterized protein LOC105566597 [Vollenhovia emeryi]
MNSSKLSRLAAIISLVIVNARSCGAESSGEYLQKVMLELQELNVPSNSLTMYDRLSSMNLGYRQAAYHGQDNRYRKVSTNNVHQDVQKPIAVVPVEHVDVAHSTANNIAQYYAVRDPTAAASYPKTKQPEPLAFTRAELAALYKKALEKGSAISVASLTQALNGNAPAQADHPELPVKPMYNYYFFPLKSFASELQRDHHQAAIVPMYAATETVESTQKQLMNPLFVAIGTFISMALLFMMGVLFLPKLPHLIYNARLADNDDFLRLTTLVMNAIDGRNRWQNFSTAS